MTAKIKAAAEAAKKANIEFLQKEAVEEAYQHGYVDGLAKAKETADTLASEAAPAAKNWLQRIWE